MFLIDGVDGALEATEKGLGSEKGRLKVNCVG